MYPDAVRSTITRAEDLQDRMVRLAYALHFAAADAATVLEERGKVVDPAPVVDTTALARRWRTASDAALGIARAWDPGTGLRLPSTYPDAVDLEPSTAATAVDVAVRHLHAAGRRIQSVMPPIAESLLQQRLHQTAADVEEALQAVRAVAILLPGRSAGLRR